VAGEDKSENAGWHVAFSGRRREWAYCRAAATASMAVDEVLSPAQLHHRRKLSQRDRGEHESRPKWRKSFAVKSLHRPPRRYSFTSADPIWRGRPASSS